MAVRVKTVTILDDTLKTPVNRLKAVVGATLPNQPFLSQLNVRIDLDSGGIDIPDEIPIEVRVLEPKKHRDNLSSKPVPFKTTAKRDGKTRTYTVSVDPFDPKFSLKTDDTSLKRVATVVRDGGTSAGLFRSILVNGGWAWRGHAKQPKIGLPTSTVTGDINDEQPDAKTLFLVGGVELMEVRVPASPGLQVNPLAKSWVFVRSPTDVFFYSGHGHFKYCNLLLDAGHDDSYRDWLEPEDILASWSDRPRILIINGCGVLGHHGKSMDWADTTTMPPCALRWRKLLKKEGGPLDAILGYRGTAPMDRMSGGQVGGDQIASEMAQLMLDSLKDDWGSYAKKWVEINAKYPWTRTATAMDEKGYYYINHEKDYASHLHGKDDLPGFDPTPSKLDAVVGPTAIPAPKGYTD
jgi:hypothetical protein